MLDDDFGLTLKLYGCFQKSIDLTKHRSQHSAQTHSLVSFLDQFKKTLIIVHPDCPQRYYAYLLQFDSNVKNPSITVVICIGNSMICSDIWHKYHE